MYCFKHDLQGITSQMSYKEDLVRERVAFLSRPVDQLRQLRGAPLYQELQALGLTHQQFFRAMDVSVTDYCAQEFGVDLSRISVERFFGSDPNAKWLFPDIVRESVVAGMQRKPYYPGLIVRDEPVQGTHYDVAYVEESAEEQELRGVAEGAAIPESEITYGNRTIKLQKLGRGVVASYEAVRRMSLDVLRVHLMRIGERLGRVLDARLATVLFSGDSSGNTAPASVDTAAANTWAYSDLLGAYLTLQGEHGFTPTHLVTSIGTAQSILTLTEFKDAALFDAVKSGSLPTPLGATLVPIASVPDGAACMFDKNFAVQKVTEQDLLIESDKLINQQWDRTYLTVVTDFAVVYNDARLVINADWS